jgi:uncharacterized protein (TIGR03435 family)
MELTSSGGHTYARAQGYDEPISRLVGMLSGQLAAPVEDETGLTEKYDYVLSWIPQPPGVVASDIDEVGPTLLSAVQDQLGLKLVPKKGPVDIIVIDHADREPSEN